MVQPQHTAKNRTAEISTSGRAMHGQRGHVTTVTMANADSAFLALRFCSHTVRRSLTQYDRPSYRQLRFLWWFITNGCVVAVPTDDDAASVRLLRGRGINHGTYRRRRAKEDQT